MFTSDSVCFTKGKLTQAALAVLRVNLSSSNQHNHHTETDRHCPAVYVKWEIRIDHDPLIAKFITSVFADSTLLDGWYPPDNGAKISRLGTVFLSRKCGVFRTKPRFQSRYRFLEPFTALYPQFTASRAILDLYFRGDPRSFTTS